MTPAGNYAGKAELTVKLRLEPNESYANGKRGYHQAESLGRKEVCRIIEFYISGDEVAYGKLTSEVKENLKLQFGELIQQIFGDLK